MVWAGRLISGVPPHDVPVAVSPFSLAVIFLLPFSSHRTSALRSMRITATTDAAHYTGCATVSCLPTRRQFVLIPFAVAVKFVDHRL